MSTTADQMDISYDRYIQQSSQSNSTTYCHSDGHLDGGVGGIHNDVHADKPND